MHLKSQVLTPKEYAECLETCLINFAVRAVEKSGLDKVLKKLEWIKERKKIEDEAYKRIREACLEKFKALFM